MGSCLYPCQYPIMTDGASQIVFRRTLRLETFECVRDLLQQIWDSRPGGAMVFTEAIVSPQFACDRDIANSFIVGVSDGFSVLLRGDRIADRSLDTSFLSSTLTFDGDDIAAFLETLAAGTFTDGHRHNLGRARSRLQPNDPQVQSQFTFALFDLLEQAAQPPSLRRDSDDLALERYQVLDEIIAQVDRNFDLSLVLARAVEKIRQCLHVDRLLVYQFDADRRMAEVLQPHNGDSIEERARSGCVTYQARSSDRITSLLSYGAPFRVGGRNCQLEKYRQGCVLTVDDLKAIDGFPEETCQFWQTPELRSMAIFPIVGRGQLWGLLVAHHCFQPRIWSESDKQFLQQVSRYLSIAVVQSRLSGQLAQEHNNLERCVSERTQALEDAVLAAQAANRIKNEFISTMSHELRTPLTCVIGMSATLLHWSLGQLSPKQREYLQKIHSSGEKLMGSIDNILDISRLESGQLTLHSRWFSLSRLVRQTLRLVEDRARDKDIELNAEVEIEPEEDQFCADRDRVRQSLLNLLNNAIKFTPKGGKTLLKVQRDRSTAIFEIQDTGIGIPDDRKSLLFQAFQQLDSTHTRSYEGMGLGLALAKQFIELHGGSIEVESAVGVGSKFTVRLPLQTHVRGSRSDGLSAAEGGLEMQAKANRNIVLISDRDEEATLICNVLTAAGYHVVWTIEGSTALDRLEVLHPKVALIDADLSDMDGCDIISSLRGAPSTRSIKILPLVDANIPDRCQYYLECGADNCLQKPVEPEELLNCVAALVTV